jgi:hypothetical protein
MATAKQEYVPGVCNIGKAEIHQRWMIGWISLVVGIVMWAAFIAMKVAPAWRLSLFVPATLATVGFLQAAWHFCAKFGLNGVFNFGPNVGKTDTVEQAEFRRQDRRTALQIIGLSVLAGVAVAAAAYCIPL